jgi:hypothetical protein
VLEHARGNVHAIDEGQARIGHVEGHAVVAHAQVARDDRGGGRLQEVAADRGVDQQADLVDGDAGIVQRLACGHGGRIRSLGLVVPQATGMDAGDVIEHVGLDSQPVEGRLQADVDFGGGQRVRRIDMRQSRDGDVLEKHWTGAQVQAKGHQG